MGLYQDLTGADPLSEAAGGEALITLPDGASVAGGANYSVPVHAASPLAKAPIAGLFQNGPSGPLPVIAPDGRVPAQAYARPFRSNGKPKVALIVGGLGLNAAATRAALQETAFVFQQRGQLHGDGGGAARARVPEVAPGGG